MLDLTDQRTFYHGIDRDGRVILTEEFARSLERNGISNRVRATDSKKDCRWCGADDCASVICKAHDALEQYRSTRDAGPAYSAILEALGEPADADYADDSRSRVRGHDTIRVQDEAARLNELYAARCGKPGGALDSRAHRDDGAGAGAKKLDDLYASMHGRGDRLEAMRVK